MEATSSASSSCWCCAECIQSRRDRHAAAATASDGVADDDDDDDDDDDGDVQQAEAVYNGLVDCDSQLLCVDEAHAHVSSYQDMFNDHLVWIALFSHIQCHYCK